MCQRARLVAYKLWQGTFRQMLDIQEEEEGLIQMAQANESNVVPVQDAMEIGLYFIERAVDCGALLLTLVMGKAFGAPLIPLDVLRRFFDDPRFPSDEDDREHFRKIQVFIQNSYEQNCFCPAEPSKMDPVTNISCHITSPGGEGGRELNGKSLFRVAPPKNPGLQEENPCPQIGKRIFSEFRELHEVCHFPTPDVVGSTLGNMMDDWGLDLSGLLSSNIFDYRDHLVKLGLDHLLPGIQNWVSEERPPFLRKMMIIDGNQTNGMAVGVDPFMLLVIVSCCRGTLLHPLEACSNFARSIMTLLAEIAPPGVIPGAPPPPPVSALDPPLSV